MRAALPSLGFLLGLLLSVGAYSPASAQTIYVDIDATGANDGSSWTDAYTDLNTALDNATGSDEIWIAEGVYTPGASEGDSFTITGNKDGLALYGGFEGTENSRSERAPAEHQTILSGDLGGNDVDPDGDGIIGDADPDDDGTPENLNGENAHHVLVLDGGGNKYGSYVNANVTSATVIDGVAITAGYDDGSLNLGGGVYCDGNGSGNECSPTLRNVVFAGNASADRGGAIYSDASDGGTASPRITNAVLVGNAAFTGGAVYNTGFNGGTANPTMTNATVTDNTATNDGGAIYNQGDNGFIGSGTASPTIANTIFWGNGAGGSGGEMYNGGSLSGADLSHTIIEGGVNGPKVEGDNGGSNTDNGGNLDQDPQFEYAFAPAGDDGVLGTDDDGLHVLPGSPALDAGDDAAIPSGVTADVAGAARTQNGTVDLGAYEGARDPARTLYVKSGAAGGTGLGWGEAFPDPQTAIENATGNDEIWVAQGVYTPDSEGDSFTIPGTKDGLKVYGGFESGDSFSARAPRTNRTILSGDLAGDDVDPDGDGMIEDADPNDDGTPENLKGGENAHHVLIVDGGTEIGSDVGANVTSATVIDGLVVTAGQADAGSAPDSNGGGLYCDGAGSGNACSPTVRNVVFAGNAAGSEGGGMFLEGDGNGDFDDDTSSNPQIANTVFAGNVAPKGGAIYTDARNAGVASPQITNVVFTDNAVSGKGGAIYNDAEGSGTSNPQITNVTFTDNVAGTDGGAIYNEGDNGGFGNGTASPTIVNTILWGNGASGSGGEIYNSGSLSSASLAHTIIEGGVNGAGVAGDATNTDDGNNLDQAPRFADASTPAGPDGTYTTADDGVNVGPGSAAIDAGVNDAVSVTVDVTGAARTQDQDGPSGSGAVVNLGAYEPVPTGPPLAETDAAQNVTPTSATIHGTASAAGQETTVEVQYYPTADPSAATTVAASPSPLSDGDFTGRGVSAALSGLTPRTEYDARVLATNADGSDQGTVVTFTTPSSAPPTATTDPPSSVGTTSATVAGTVNPNGAETTVAFAYRAVGAASFTSVTAAESPLTGTADQSVSATVSGLQPATDYEVKVTASNSEGTDEGSLKTVTTETVDVAVTGGGSGGLNRAFSATPGQGDQPVGVVRLTPAQSGVDLTEVSVTPDSPSATGIDRAALWVSDDNSFEAAGDAALASLDLDPQTDLPSPLTFDGFSEGLPGQARYLFVTVTLTDAAAGTITGVLESETALALSGGAITEVNGNGGQSQFSNLPLSAEGSPLPVELAGFDGTTTEDGVQLRWKTASEQNNTGFRILRRGEGTNGREGAWTEVGFVEGSGTTSEAKTYRFTDADLPYAADSVSYRLRQVDTDGSTHLTDPVTIGRSGPDELELLGTFPNPARQRATVQFAVPESAAERDVRMHLYDVLGRRVHTVRREAEAGRHTFRLDTGRLASGVYVLRLQASGTIRTQKLTVVR